MTHRPHGTRVKYVIDRCRCDDCREASRATEAHRRRQRAYGIQSYVDATPARTHVRRLGAQGMGWKRVARAAGLAPSTVWKLVYGDNTRYGRPSKRIRPATSEAILAVTLDLADGALIDSTGTARRLQALIAIGWSAAQLGNRINVQPTNMTALVEGRRPVTIAKARDVSNLYDELSMTPPQANDQRSRISVARSINRAKANRWAPPLAWDEDLIDDPAAKPATVDNIEPHLDDVAIERRMAGDRTIRLTRAEKYELATRWQNTRRPLKELERVTGLNAQRYLRQGAEAS